MIGNIDEMEKLNSILVSEANKILYDYGLLSILNKFGRPIIQGSYSLNLMTWRDLDIHLENDKMDIKDFFDLGSEMARKLKPRRMSFRNEFIGKTPDLPKGLYWGIYTKLTFPDEWKIDIWAMDSGQIRAYSKIFIDLKSKKNEYNRLTIFMIKSHFCKHPEYRKSFPVLTSTNPCLKKT